jgi:SAM-dependent methyltransferase
MNDFYGEDQASIHHREFGDLALTAAALVRAELREARHGTGTVVDLGCGSGILARALTDEGYRVVGVDLSHDMLEIAREVAPEAELSVASVHDVEIPPAVAVTAIGEVLNYATDARAGLAALGSLARRVHDALEPDGLFAFDVALPGRHGPMARRVVFHDREDWSLAMEAVEDGDRLDRRIVVFRRTPSPDEQAPPPGDHRGPSYRRTDEHHVLRLYEPGDVAAVLVEAGFVVERRPGYGPSATRSTPEQGWAVFVCRTTAPGRT